VDYWDGQAATFDDEPDHGLRDPRVRAAWRDLLLTHTPVAPARVADLGCGTGTLSVLLAEEGYDVHGIDLSGQMVAAARAKARAAGVAGTFTQGDAGDPPLAEAAFDVVLSRHVLWALPDPQTALRRWCELLAPGGRLLLVEGFWFTGGGLHAVDVERLVRATGRRSAVLALSDPAYWGHEIDDERYLLVSPAP
jgi:2-polyprenyl-3-methyl-5-hydroxy-6-metoxy-1,4-benzoquinol methylase